MSDKRPKHLALHQISFPLPAIVSILHRISGVLLFLCLPMLLWIFQTSLTSIETYTLLSGVLRQPASKLLLIGVLWAFLHHFCAGIRYLFIDMDYGVRLTQARASSRWVLVLSLGLTAVLGVRLW